MKKLNRPKAATSAAEAPIRVLLLEDNSTDARLNLHALKVAGLQVESEIVNLSHDFKQRVKANTYDIILGDYNLPEWTGLEAFRWLRSAGYTQPFILVSGTLGDDVAVECIKEGVTDYVIKNRLARLPLAVRRALDEEKLRRNAEQAERELRASEEQYRLLFEANSNPLWVYDTETLRFLAVNKAAIEHYGFTRNEFFSMTLKDILAAEELPRFATEFAKWGKSANVDSSIWVHRKKNGTLMNIEANSRPITFRGRQARLVLALDISARLRAENERRASEELFATQFHSSPEGITITTLHEGRYVEANDAFLRMVGYERSELIGKTSLELGIWVDPEKRNDLFEHLLVNKSVIGLEGAARTKTGKIRQFQVSAARIQFRESPCLLFHIRDVTNSRLLQRQFQQAQKMEAVGRLAGGVAHDVNNMLMIIGSYAQLLEDANADPTKAKRYAHEIREAIKKTASITHQLLAFSRKQVLEPTVLNLNAVLSDFGRMLPRLIGEDIEMSIYADPATGQVSADRGQLEQVIMNLVVNARDAMPKGGRLVIETSNVELDESSAQRHGAQINPGQYVMLAVTDNGIGMDAETQSQIFEPFFTTKEQGKGTGLGLATVYGIVKQSGGFIWVYSEPGKGSTFKVYLPRIKSKPSAALIPTSVEIASPGSETIMLVEDEPALREATSEYLRSKGYTVIEASSGIAAVEWCRKHQRKVHLLLTDIVMPGIGGPELAQAVLKNRSEMRVIYMSGYTDRSVEREILGPAITFLQKPFNLDTLAKCIRTLLDKTPGAAVKADMVVQEHS